MPSSPSNASKELLNTPTSPATRLGEREGSEGGSSVEDGAAFPGPEGVLGRGEVHETERYGREEEAERRLGEGGGRVEELGEEEEERDSTPRASLELLSHSSEKVYDAPTRHEQEEEGEPTLSPITAPPHWTFTPSSPSPLSSFPLTSPSLSPSRPSTAQHRLTDPPTPLAVPGGWSSSRWTEAPLRWRVLGKGKGRASDEDEEGEEEEDEGLVLPPPFLADDSPKESFDGLLGGRTSRRLSRLARHHARLYAQGRAPPPPFPHNVVKAAAKVVRLLGPPGGYDHRRPVLEREEGEKKGKGKGKGMSLDQAAQIVETALSKERRDEGGRQEERQRRRVKRAESGLRAYEIGVEVGRRVAGRLERHRSRRGELVSQLTAEGKRDEASRRSDSLVAATPAQLLGVPPSPSSVGGPIKGSSSSYPASTGDIDDIPPLPPAAPALRPLSIPDLPPLPTVATPFNLDPSSPDDYFALQKRRRTSLSSNSPSKLAAFAIPSTPKTPFILQPLPNPSPMRTALLGWVIFLLIGSPRAPTVAGFDSSLATVGGLIGILVHSLGFLFFVAYHLTTLLISSYGALRTTAVFIYWAGLNLSGRTEVSKAVVEYWRTCRSEWDKVVDEEGEDTVSVIAVLKGVLELAALHRMTRQRWLQDGPGHLKLLNGVNDVPTRLATPRFGPLRPRQSIDLERPSITQRQQSWRWTSNGGEEDGEGLVVTGHEGGILQGSTISHEEPRSLPSARSQKPSQASPDKRATINQLLEEEPPPLDLAEPEPSQLPASPPLQPIDERADPVADLVALIKRHCRLSTASYGLHTMLPSPPTPLLTPSGQTLPHRLFAHLGGLTDHRNVLHVALQKRYTGIPSVEDEIEATYAPQFYVLRDDLRAEVVVVIRGTQSLADVRTDLDGSLIPLDLPTPPTPASHEPQEPRTISSPYRIHSGILATARHLLSPVSTSPLYSKLAAILAEHPRYGLVFTGHSLGAALASSLAILLGEYNEAERRWVVSDSSSLASLSTPDSDRPPLFRRPVRAVCFAHPTTVNAPLSQYCATPNSPDGVPLVINVSLGADVICRMGIPQVKELRRAIGRLDKMRKRESSGILSSRREWAKLDRAIEEADDEEREQLERKREELVDCAWRLRCAAEGWLDGGDAVKEDDVDTAIPAGRCYHLDHLPPDVEVKRRAELRKAREVEGDESAGDDEDELLCGLYEVRDPRRFYAMPLLEADLVAAHMPKAYLDQVESL